MSKTTNTNFDGVWQYAGADGDQFDRTDVSGPASALNAHDHSSGKGLPAVRIGPSGSPVTISGTPAAGQALIATSTTAAAWSAIPSSESDLSGDVAMTNANTAYDGASISLTAGTYLLIAGVSVSAGVNAPTIFTAKLWDGTTVESSTHVRDATNGGGSTMTLAGFVSPGSTTTYKISVLGNTAANTIKAAAIANGAGNNATWIRAIRLG